MRRSLPALLLAALLLYPNARVYADELVSLRCAQAIGAVLAEIGGNSQNIVLQQALDSIDDVNGQLVCIPISADEIQVRLQSTEMSDSDNRLVFSLDTKSYAVRKIFYGR